MISEMGRILYIDCVNRRHRLCNVERFNSLLPFSIPLANYLATDGEYRAIKNRDFFIISIGILGGHSGVGLSVATFTGISPQSNGVIEAKVEGKLAASLRSLDLDAIAIVGAAENLCGLEIEKKLDEMQVTFIDARNLTGRTVWETTFAVSRGSQDTILAIGAAGEKQAKSASVVVDYGFPTQTGGVGAILGRLAIKYVRIIPHEFVQPNHVVRQISAEYLSGIRAGNILSKFHFDPPGFGVYVNSALSGYLAGGNFAPCLPIETKQFDASSYLKYLDVSAGSSCPGCPQECLKVYRLDKDQIPIDGGRLHQLSVTVFASQWADPSPERAIEFNSYCHEIGVEHLYISALLSQERPNKTLPVTALVDSVYEKELNETSMTVKGMPLPPFDPRGNQGLGLAMSLNPSGPRYDVIEHDIDFDPNWSWTRHAIFGQEFGYPEGGLPIATLDERRFPAISQIWHLWSAMDALGVCIFASPPTRDLRLSHIMSMVKSITGIDVDREKLFALGKLRLACQRELNSLLGLTSVDDDLPSYFFDVPINAIDAKNSEGPIFGNENVSSSAAIGLSTASLSRDDFDAARKAIYQALSWDLVKGVDHMSAVWKDMNSLQVAFSAAMNA